jgi:hypothetical protein
MAQKQFEFLSNTDETVPFLKQILEYVKHTLPVNANAQILLFKAKVILTELLTNALKHSGSKSALIDIKVTKKTLTITKTDYGTPLLLIAQTNSINKKVPVTNDVLHILYAKSIAENQVKFSFKENKLDEVLVIDNVAEHFGFLIITKAADRFIYKHEHSSQANIFSVLVKVEV